jgi:hypothetical protein
MEKTMNEFKKIAYRWIQYDKVHEISHVIKSNKEIARMQTEDLIARLMLPKKENTNVN